MKDFQISGNEEIKRIDISEIDDFSIGHAHDEKRADRLYGDNMQQER